MQKIDKLSFALGLIVMALLSIIFTIAINFSVAQAQPADTGALDACIIMQDDDIACLITYGETL